MQFPISRVEMAGSLRRMADAIERPRAGILIPLYIRPGAPWDRVSAAKLAHPMVSIIAIANPRNGPGDAKSAAYADAIPTLARSGTVVAGYVHSQYGVRPTADVERDMRRWKEWYPQTESLFVDEFSSKPEHLTYYQNLRKVARDLDFRCVVGNPGTKPHRDMYTTADVLVVSERSEAPSVDELKAFADDGGKGKMAVLVHSAAAGLVDSWIPQVKTMLSYLYLTEDVKPSPWDTISAKFEREVEILDS